MKLKENLKEIEVILDFTGSKGILPSRKPTHENSQH